MALYADGKEKRECVGCGNFTRGILLLKQEDNPLPTRIPFCPRCRDTKSKVKRITQRFGVEVEQIIREEVDCMIPNNKLVCPQKGISYWDMKPEQQEVTMNDVLLLCEPKFDGGRATLYLLNGSATLLSSRLSKRTGNYSDRSANFPQITSPQEFNPHKHTTPYSKALEDTVLDGEIYIDAKQFETKSGKTDSTLNMTVACMNASPSTAVSMQKLNCVWAKLMVFDCLRYAGRDLRDQPLKIRRSYALRAVELLDNKYIEFVDAKMGMEKQAAFEEAIGMGYEGLMLKDPEAHYYAPSKGARNKGWIKWKKMESHDGFITGYIAGRAGFKGLVGALLISAYTPDGTKFEFCAVSNIPLEQRREMSASDGSLKEEYYSRVVEIRAQTRTRTDRLRHATILRWRSDKSREECLYVLKH